MKRMLIIFFITIPILSLSQSKENTILVGIPEVPLMSKKGKKNNSKMHPIDTTAFANVKIKDVKKAFPSANRNSVFSNVYEIKVEGDVKSLLCTLNSKKYENIFLNAELKPQIYSLHQPSDYIYNGNENSIANFLNLEKTWDITKGNSSILIGIVESNSKYDIDHEDLADNIVYFEPNSIATSSIGVHGTWVAGCAGATTNNGIGIISPAYNSKLRLYTNGYNGILQAAMDGVDIINCSFASLQKSNWYKQIIDTVVNMYGVTIVAGAGNGTKWETNHFSLGTCSNGIDTVGSGRCLGYPASYDNVISVTSIGHHNDNNGINTSRVKDVHESTIGLASSAHTHNEEIDICAPGYAVLTTDYDDKYIGFWGTSAAAPLVASVCALILDIKPCLTPSEIKNILVNTGLKVDTIPENINYIGKIGRRINPYEAIKSLDFIELKNETYDVDSTFTSATIISINNIIVNNNSNINIKSRGGIFIEGPLRINAGSMVSFEIDNTLKASCE